MPVWVVQLTMKDGNVNMNELVEEKRKIWFNFEYARTLYFHYIDKNNIFATINILLSCPLAKTNGA